MVRHAYIDEYILPNAFVMVTYAVLLVIGDICGDWWYSPQAKKNLIAGEFGIVYLPKIFGKPMGEWGYREKLITFAGSTILIFASYAELPYLSRLLTIPTRFSDYFLISHVLSAVLLPILHYFNFDGTDEHNLSQFMTGITGLIVFPSSTWILHNWNRISVFLYVLVFNVKSVAFLVPAFGIIALWKKIVPDDWKARGKAYVWKNVWSSFRYLAVTVTTNFGKFLTLLRMFVGFFNWCDSWVIEKRNSRMPTKQPYVYTALKGPREVRLLKLSRRTLFAAYQCELMHVNLDAQQHYEAISYTWGGEKPTLDMIVKGKILKVTPAVYDIVSYRQTFLRSQYFWIDAVCINQEDINERGQQVGLMRDIYKQASRVVVWLGPLAKAEDANLARGMLHFLAYQNYVPSVSPDDIYKSAIMDRPGWDAVSEIFAHRWFSRVWVIQEVAVATTVHVMYGRTCTGWEAFVAAGNFMTDSKIYGPAQITTEESVRGRIAPKVVDKIVHLMNLLVMARAREAVLIKQPMSLGEALFLGLSFQSTDPRDKVYGLLGIIRDELPNSLAPDYNKPAAVLYIDTMCYLLSQQSTVHWLHPLFFAGIGFPRTAEMEKADLPSWVVDWSSQNIGRTAAGSSRISNLPFRGPEIGALHIQVPHILKVQAAEVDEIKTFSTIVLDISAISVGQLNREIGKVWMDWKDEAWVIAQGASRDIYPTDDILTTAFWRMLMGPTDHIPLAPALDVDHCSANWAYLESLLDKDFKIATMGKDESEVLKMTSRLSVMMYQIAGQCGSKRFCVTENGRLGLIPPLVRAGDRIYYFQGLRLPFTLREKRVGNGDEARHALVGTCFIDGLTDDPTGEDLRWEAYYLE